MTIKQALKQKNKLIKQIAENTKLMQQYNSVEVGNQRPYSTITLLGQIMEDTMELSSLKARIHTANAPVLEKIFWMAEMKSVIAALKKMDCTEGKSNKDRYRMESELVLTSEISLVERNERIKSLESKIEEIQDTLDHFNAVTEI
jgi:CII-binding regulator of phage lambda lysogenization HflD